MIKLKRLNVVKLVESEFRAQQLERQGFKRVIEEQLKQESEEIAQLRERAKELGVPRASQLGEAKLRAAIAEKEAENNNNHEGGE